MNSAERPCALDFVALLPGVVIADAADIVFRKQAHNPYRLSKFAPVRTRSSRARALTAASLVGAALARPSAEGEALPDHDADRYSFGACGAAC